MKSFEGQFNLQEELDKAGTHKDYLEKQNKDQDAAQEEKLRLERLRLEEERIKELDRLKELEDNDNPSDEYFGRFEKFKKRQIK